MCDREGQTALIKTTAVQITPGRTLPRAADSIWRGCNFAAFPDLIPIYLQGCHLWLSERPLAVAEDLLVAPEECGGVRAAVV